MSLTKGIAIVMPARNAASTIVTSLRSVLAAPEVTEVIVIDDGSQDGTGDLARSLGDARLRVIAGPAQGIAAALNAGILAAQAPYVARCDSDDTYVPGRLGGQLAFLETHPDYVAISTGFASVDRKGRHLADLATRLPEGEVTERLRAGQVLTHLCTWLIRREALGALGGARPWFETAEDVDLQFRLAGLGRVWHRPQVGYLYLLHEASIVHQSRAERLAFFDAAARDFALERAAGGRDALDRGCPPQKPVLQAAGQGILSDQITGHLTGQAWHDFSTGHRRAAFARMVRAIRHAPSRPDLWQGLLVMGVKTLILSIGGKKK